MYEREVPRKHLQAEKIEAVREEVEEKYNLSLPLGKNEEFYENHELVRKQERPPAWKKIKSEIKEAEEDYFECRLLDEMYNMAVKSLHHQDPKRVVQRTREKIDEFEDHADFFYGIQERYPEYFPDVIDIDLENLWEAKSLKTIEEVKKSLIGNISQLIDYPTGKIETPITPTEEGIDWKTDFAPREESGFPPRLGELISYVGSHKR